MLKQADQDNETQSLLKENSEQVTILKENDIVEGTIINIAKSNIYVNLKSKGVGVVYGREYKLAEPFGPFKINQTIAAGIVDLENENGYIELSIKDANLKNAWTNLNAIKNKNEIKTVKIFQANKGGLMAKLEGILGFLPVSQLSPNNYPRVKNGDKQEILRRLKSLIGKELPVKVIDIDPKEDKLVLSEKAVVQEENKEELKSYEIGDIVDGTISGVVDFGAFIKFGNNQNIEGLIHISELSWAKVEDPRSIVKLGDKIKAKIVSFAKDRIALSLKRLSKDPWDDLNLKVGQAVEGKVQNINHFGIFVEIAKNVNGLLHTENVKIAYGDVSKSPYKLGGKYKFVISGLDKTKHRMALEISKEAKVEEKEPKKTKPAVAVAPKAKPEPGKEKTTTVKPKAAKKKVTKTKKIEKKKK
jgi:small subunit ribosomal protein S1